MKNGRYFKLKLLFVVFAMISGCESLDTVNNNNPDLARVLSSGTDIPSFLTGGYLSFWQGVTDDHPAMALEVTGDAYGISWGNFGMQRMGNEPRDPYNNQSSEPIDYRQVVNDPWFGMSSAIFTANSVIKAISIDGVTLDDGGDQDLSLLAGAYFLRGVSRGYLGLLFDRAFIVNEDTDITQQLPFSSYQDMIAAAISDLNTAITTAQGAGAGFSHNFFNGVTFDSGQFIELSNSYAARFLVQWPRNEAETASVAWSDVKTHAAAGLSFDFAPMSDGNLWDSYHKYAFSVTGQGPFWAHVDQRLISAMDPTQPSRYPEIEGLGEAPIPNPVAISADARLLSDMVYVDPGSINLPIARGEWHFSHYKHNRNVTDPSFSGDGSTSGPMPVFRKADNDLLLAEAEMELGNLGASAAIINAGTRVTRGNLPPVAASAAELLDAIKYERAIELLSTAPGGTWLDRRRRDARVAHGAAGALDGLQIGAPAQLPIPADELGVLQEPTYNFGGAADPNGTGQ